MTTTKTIPAVLKDIQQSLKVPKNQRNTFGNYNYRNCEDILEAVKPLLKDCVLVIDDEIVNIGERYYVKATATLSNGGESISATAYAREAEDKKGMDHAQITGATSSYARKYALNGLFAIDDTKDADTMDNTSKPVVNENKSTDPTDEWEVSEDEKHYCDMHKKDLKHRGQGIWDHRAKLNEAKEYDENGVWYACTGKGWHISLR